jgi:hypothetical protein
MHGEPFSIRGGDWIVLASDGLCSLAGDEIADVIGRHRHAAPAAMAEALIDAVLAKGVAGQDNATVVAVRVEAAPGAAVDEVTTRVVLRSAPGGATVAKGKGVRSLLSSALDVSPAVWLGAAAGLLLIAVVMALTGPPHKRQPAPAVTRPPPEGQQIPEIIPPERRALLPVDPAPPTSPPTGGAPPDGQSAEDPSAAGPPSQAAPPQARPSQAARRDGQDAKKAKDKRERLPFPHTTPN